MKYVSYLINKIILLISVVLMTLFIKDNILTKNSIKNIYMKNGVIVFEENYKYLLNDSNNCYFILFSIILIFFLGIILCDKNVKKIKKIEKIGMLGMIYIILFFDTIKDILKDIKEYKNSVLVLICIFLIIFLFFLKKQKTKSEENKIFPSREQLLRSLEYYLDTGVKSILIDGEWGSGKTHFIKFFLEKRRDQYIPIWVKSSLFDGRRDIKKFIFKELKIILEDNLISINPINDLMKKFELIGNNTFINFSKVNSSFDNDIELIKKEIKKIKGKKIILIIDDLERTKNEKIVEEYISVISEIEDSLNLRALILMDFSKIKRSETIIFINKYYERHLKIPNLEYGEAVNTFFSNDTVKLCFKNYVDALLDEKTTNSDNSIFLNLLKNPRYITRSANELNEIENRINSKGSLTKSNKAFNKKVHLIYSVMSFQLLRSAFPEKNISEFDEERIGNLKLIFKKLYGTFNNHNYENFYDFSGTFKIIKILEKYNGVVIPEIKKGIDDSFKDYIELGYIQEAVDKLQDLPKNYFIYFNLGELFYELGEFKDSIVAYKNALDHIEEVKSEKDISNLHNNRAMVYEKLGNNTLAEVEYSTAIKKDSNDSMIFNNRGEFYLTLKRYSEAEDDFKKAIKINNKNTLAYYNLGILYDIQKNYKNAILNFSVAKSNSSNDFRINKLDGIISVLNLLENEQKRNSSIEYSIIHSIEKARLFMILGDLKTALLNAKLVKEELEKSSDFHSKSEYLEISNGQIELISELITKEEQY